MTQVDFYILQQEATIARMHYACRLAEKACQRGHEMLIAVDNEEQATTLSEYLWTFKPESFLPHQKQGEQKGKTPIMLIWDQDNETYHDILVNLGHRVPEGFSRFQRVIEIVVQEENCLTATRSHFQFYRERGYPLKSHQIAVQANGA